MKTGMGIVHFQCKNKPSIINVFCPQTYFSPILSLISDCDYIHFNFKRLECQSVSNIFLDKYLTSLATVKQ